MPNATDKADQPPRRVLVVSYTFPPVGGAGVQRVTKFVKYLHRYGWQPTVLTVANPSVPALDHSLQADVPEGTEVFKAASREPGYELKAKATGASADSGSSKGGMKRRLLGAGGKAARAMLQPDPQILWYSGAVREGLRVLSSQRYDAIFATAPPFSALLIASKLAKSTKVPLVVDYRDEWTISNDYWENKKLGPISSKVQSQMQKSVLRRASAVIATTRQSADSLRTLCQSASSRATVSWIYNGFDRDDFSPPATPDHASTRFRLAYTGTLWKLTSMAPLVAAAQRLADRNPGLAKELEVVIAGRRIGEQAELVEKLRNTSCQVEAHDYVPHASAIGLLQGADASCLLLSAVPGAERVVPAKLFEYMACRRPILAILPRGETWDLLDDYSHVGRFEPQDVEGITNWLAVSVERKQRGDITPTADPPHEKFSREYQTQQLAELLDQCVVNEAATSEDGGAFN